MRGFYSQPWQGKPASITLYVDKIGLPPKVLRFLPFCIDFCIGGVLYHELGHHAHRLVPEHREREDVADKWCAKFTANHYLKRYWFLKPAFLLAVKGAHLFKRPKQKQ